MITVVVADDHAIVRAGCRALLDAEADIEVVGEATDGAEAVAATRSLRPDVVLMDIRMPGADGLEATRLITSDPDLEGVRILILTTFEIDEYVFEAIRAGASGFLVRDAEVDELVRGVRAVTAGQAVLSPGATRHLIAELAARPNRRSASPARLAVLTDREREILAIVATGATNDEIAELLVISPATVRTHITRVLAKLGARSRAQLVVMAFEAGLVDAGERGAGNGVRRSS